MKTKEFYLGVLSILLLCFITVSCSKDTEEITEDTSQDLIIEQSQKAAEVDLTSEGIVGMMEIAYSEIEEDGGRNSSLFPDCVTITVNTQNGIVFVTLDFGLGCELNNGNYVSGLVHITYGPVQNGTRTINYEFENFSFNWKDIAGGGTLFIERHNANGNPQSTAHKNLIITFPNNTVATASGTRVREWIEGFGSGTWMDNVFLITGNRAINFSSGFTHSALITEALRREATCRYFVSGFVEIERNGGNALLNYGEGICDNLATLTINGVEHIIVLN